MTEKRILVVCFFAILFGLSFIIVPSYASDTNFLFKSNLSCDPTLPKDCIDNEGSGPLNLIDGTFFDSPPKIFVTSDKSIYDIGETVRITGDSSQLGIVTITIVSDKLTIISVSQTKVKPDGSFSDFFTIPNETQKGQYEIKANLDSASDSHTIQILGSDFDNDGILDFVDSCPKEAENYNRYQDSDGCPDNWPTADLNLSYLSNPPSFVIAGQTFDYQIQFYNKGPEMTHRFQLITELSSGLRFDETYFPDRNYHGNILIENHERFPPDFTTDSSYRVFVHDEATEDQTITVKITNISPPDDNVKDNQISSSIQVSSIPPSRIDSDEDGIVDEIDQCDFEPENFNGYEDTDGCPDTEEIIPQFFNIPKNIEESTTDPSGLSVDYLVPKAMAGFGTPKVTCNPPPESKFPVGSTAVFCTAEDSSGNSVTTQFKIVVTLSDTTKPDLSTEVIVSIVIGAAVVVGIIISIKAGIIGGTEGASNSQIKSHHSKQTGKKQAEKKRAKTTNVSIDVRFDFE
ncbi:MAG: HYR domain-containing protein [Nitrosopumilus sp.]|nr:HYR domain-containing protein [Nitrosopumilus sp.]